MSKYAFFNPCLISLAMTSGGIATSLTIYGNERSKQLLNTFQTIEQKQMYFIVKNERIRLYMKAYMFAICVALVYTFALGRRGQPINYCIFSLLIQSITLIIYRFYPKQFDLEPYLHTDEQKSKYKSFTQEISNSYIMGLFVGIILFFVTSSRCK
jgi:ABC-type maltose transport system permease subunit